MTQIRIAIAGASGRMGRMLIETTLKAEDAVLVAAFERPESISSAVMPASSVACSAVCQSLAMWVKGLPAPIV